MKTITFEEAVVVIDKQERKIVDVLGSADRQELLAEAFKGGRIRLTNVYGASEKRRVGFAINAFLKTIEAHPGIMTEDDLQDPVKFARITKVWTIDYVLRDAYNPIKALEWYDYCLKNPQVLSE